MPEKKIIAFVMAGGQGSRLQPLTSVRSKPSVPFGARYRIIDFVLSNLINSGVRTIYLLVQYKSQSLIEHVRKAWSLSPLLQNQFVTVVPPQMLEGKDWFQGTADAVYQNISLIEGHSPDMVAVFGADHIYRMDLQQKIKFHQMQEADVTVSALPVPLDQASAFGVMATDPHGRIIEFQEKPENPSPMPGNPDYAFASMGNYLFNTDVLLEGLRAARERGETDFGQHVLPNLMATHNLYAYDFSTNRVPGIKPYEEPVYWRDVGTIDAYFDAQQEVLGLAPKFDAFNPQWPIYSGNYQGPVARILGGQVNNTLLGAASIVCNGTKISNSIIRREAVIEEGAEIEDCIIMDYVRIGKGAKLRKVIVDRHNNIEAGARIGFDHDEDRKKYKVSSGGVVVIPLGKVGFYARDARTGGPGYAE
jgi:glucose-1-phosphate adenylyltransferase